MTARGEERSVTLEIEGPQLPPAPKPDEKPSWLAGIGGRLESTQFEKEDGELVGRWRLTIPRTLESSAPATGVAAPLRILAVAGQEEIRDLLIGMLGSLGYDASVVGGADEALDALRRGLTSDQPFKIVIADSGLQRSSGIELAKMLKNLDKDIFYLLISGWGLEPESADFLNSGIDMVLEKPFRMEQLSGIIETALQGAAS